MFFFTVIIWDRIAGLSYRLHAAVQQPAAGRIEVVNKKKVVLLHTGQEGFLPITPGKIPYSLSSPFTSIPGLRIDRIADVSLLI